MFGNQQLSGKRSFFGWGIWLFIFGLGLLLFFVQQTSSTSPQAQDKAGTSNIPTKISAESGSKEPQAEQPFLAEYDPSAIPFLAGNAEDERPLWLSGGELALKLFLVLGLVYLALLGLRWLQRGQRKLVTSGATIRVLETAGLAPGRALHLIVVGEKTLLIGATDHQLSLLAELTDVATPLNEEGSPFAKTLAATQRQSRASSSLDWQTAFDNLRTSVQRIRPTGPG